VKTVYLKSVDIFRVLLAVGITAFVIGQFLDRSLGTCNIVNIVKGAPFVLGSKERLSSNPFVNNNYWHNRYVDGNVATLPYPHYWPVDEMFDAIEEVMKAYHPASRYRLAAFTNYEWMSGDFLTYKIWQHRLNSKISLTLPLPPPKDRVLQEFLGSYEFLITKSGDIFKENFYVLSWAKESQEFVKQMLASDGQVLKRHNFKVLRRFSLPDGSFGTVWVSDNVGKVLPLLDLFPASRVSAPDRHVNKAFFMIDGKAREIVFLHPPSGPGISEVRWPDLKIPAGASFEFGIALDQNVWAPEKGDGVGFSVDIERNGTRENVFAMYLDPKNKSSDRKWFDYRIDLSKYGGSQVDLILSTSSGPRGDHSFDHAGWSNLTIRGK
jgi:hypothetical protein